MNYSGYQIKIGDLKLPFVNEYEAESRSIFENGSYSFKKEKRLNTEWQDANGKYHHETFPNEKVTISFNIKERTAEQQALLFPLLSQQNNITVEYWDDIDATYKTGVFFMDQVESISSIATRDSILYAPLSIVLTEY